MPSRCGCGGLVMADGVVVELVELCFVTTSVLSAIKEFLQVLDRLQVANMLKETPSAKCGLHPQCGRAHPRQCTNFEVVNPKVTREGGFGALRQCHEVE